MLALITACGYLSPSMRLLASYSGDMNVLYFRKKELGGEKNEVVGREYHPLPSFVRLPSSLFFQKAREVTSRIHNKSATLACSRPAYHAQVEQYPNGWRAIENKAKEADWRKSTFQRTGRIWTRMKKLPRRGRKGRKARLRKEPRGSKLQDDFTRASKLLFKLKNLR